MKKTIISLFAALALCLGLVIPAMAAETEVKTAEELQAALNKGGEIVLGSDIGAKSSLVVKSSAQLDLNGYKLTVVTKRDSGIIIDLGQTLTILDSRYVKGVSDQGKLSVNGYRAGIQTSGATLIIDSGIVEAAGQWATGIGGIDAIGFYDGGTVIINGGTVTAKGGCPGVMGGAGIGGFSGDLYQPSGNGGTVTINGGTVTATGGTYAAGIGGGGSAAPNLRQGGNGGTVTITGGVVKAVAGGSRERAASDIGSGSGGEDGGTLKITGGIVELGANGTDAKISVLKRCTITGAGAGDHKGNYDPGGQLVVVEGASSWASESVARAIANGLVPRELQSNHTQPATRAEFCALATALYETVSGEEIGERKSFSDTNDPNIEKMGALGVVSGVGADRFDPNGTLTREQAAVMLARLAEALERPLPESRPTFVDNETIASWAFAQVGQVQGANIMGGVGNGLFDPAGLYSREQSIATILRLFDALN
ncbi:MAG: S-layer homology domain-containing protein [Lawsonibacter sp.]|nr:S-layer homology domain-containing protein [Lawsonibacter sp.]